MTIKYTLIVLSRIFIIKYKTIDNLFDVLSNIDKKYVLNKDVDVQITINPSRF